MAGGDINRETVKANRDEFLATCREAGKDPAENHGLKQRQYTYLGVVSSLPCESLLDTYYLHKEAFIREKAVL